MRNFQSGIWFHCETKSQHECLKKYGTVSPPRSLTQTPRVQYGEFSGPGKYMLCSYEQPCPRGCCQDQVHEVIRDKEVAKLICEEIRELAEILKAARSGTWKKGI